MLTDYRNGEAARQNVTVSTQSLCATFAKPFEELEREEMSAEEESD